MSRIEWKEDAPVPRVRRRPKPRKLGEASLDYIEFALKEGKSMREIARNLDVPLTVVRNAIEEFKDSRFIFMKEAEAQEAVRRARIKYQLASEQIADEEIKVALSPKTPLSVKGEYIRSIKDTAGLTRKMEVPQQIVFIDARKVEQALKGIEEVFGKDELPDDTTTTPPDNIPPEEN